ncbi:MAG: FHA domain-containing protein [Planctomyces sp.]|nr:FHA domain-containing protein [Planctomyces sp.]
MVAVARLIVTRGPDEGRAFDVSLDLAHIGSGDSNQIVLSDPSVAPHQASIVCRGGRFALYTPMPGGVQVDGAAVPPERWIWLPSAAQIHLGEDTVVQFETQMTSPETTLHETHSLTADPTPGGMAAAIAAASCVAAAAPAPQAPKAEGSSSTASRKRRKADPKRRTARIVLDPQGEPRVQLGADGRLPELQLADASEASSEAKPRGAAPSWLLLPVVLASAALSLGLLFWTPGDASSQPSQSRARDGLRAFFGEDGQTLEPYQQLLRQALLEHSQGRPKEERRNYVRVLDLLNSADVRDPRNFHGLTGRQTGRGRNSDADLRALLETLIALPE